MAHLEETTSGSYGDIAGLRRKVRAWRILAVVLILFVGPGWFLLFFVSVLFGQRIKRMQTELEILEAGLEGERKTRSIFAKLDDRYIVFSDLTLEVSAQRSQIDHIVVGPTGVFVIETKNLNGYIEGQASDHQVVQHKVGRKGGEYQKQLYNPVRQVSTHVYRVAQLLKKNGLKIWVTGVVYFSNPDAEVALDGGPVAVLCAADDGEEQLHTLIEGASGNVAASDVQLIVRLIRSARVDSKDTMVLTTGAPRSRPIPRQDVTRRGFSPSASTNDAADEAKRQHLLSIATASEDADPMALQGLSANELEQLALQQNLLDQQQLEEIVRQMHSEADHAHELMMREHQEAMSMSDPYMHPGIDVAIDHDYHGIPNGLGGPGDFSGGGFEEQFLLAQDRHSLARRASGSPASKPSAACFFYTWPTCPLSPLETARSPKCWG